MKFNRRLHRPAAGSISAKCAVITSSDTRTEKTDLSGKIASQILSDHGHSVLVRTIVPNVESRIRTAIKGFLKDGCDLVLITGGTGAGPRDVSVQAVRSVIDREMEGFGELFRMLSWDEIGSTALMSRALLGLKGTQVVAVTPGSPNAVKLALGKLLAPELAHLLAEARGED